MLVEANRSLSAPVQQLPLIHVTGAAFESWAQGDLPRAEGLLTEEIIHPSSPFHHAQALAHRSLVRSRVKQWDMAVDDAKKVIYRLISSHLMLTTTRLVY